MSLFDAGESEGLKFAVHAALGALTMTCTVYNGIAWSRRTDERRHLAMNAIVYGALTALEVRKCYHHCAGSDV